MNTDEQWMQDGERVSALIDGRLQDADLTQTLKVLQTSPRARAAWADYHLLREALQAGQVRVSADDAEFLARLRQRLAPQQARPAAVMAAPATPLAQRPRSSANDARWKRVAGLASLAAVAVVAWQGVQRIPAAREGAAAQVARVSAPPAGPALVLMPLEHEPIFAATQPVMIRDARLDALLAASRQTGGAAATQASSGFVRNAAFAQAGR